MRALRDLIKQGKKRCPTCGYNAKRNKGNNDADDQS
jgi:hypothetical protein